jgi:hypothetical protein
MSSELNGFFVFFIIASCGLFARFSTKNIFRPLAHLSLFTLAIFLISFLYIILMEKFSLNEAIINSIGIVVTTLCCFYFFRYLVLKFEKNL